MLIEIKVPALAESVPDATLLDWYKQPGDAVARGENLIDLETDKVTLEIASPEAGVVTELLHQPGDVVLPDVVLCIIDTEAKATASAAEGPAKVVAAAVEPLDTPRFGPSVRKLIEEHRIDPGQVPASGKDGRLTKADVLAYIESQQAAAEAARAPAPPVQARPAEVPGARPEERIPMTRLRKRTAERLLQAQQQCAILTTFNEVNMQCFMDLRAQHKEEFERQNGVRLGFMSIFVKAAVEALKKYPIVNAYIDGDDVIYHGYYDIGVAVGSDRGLVVPLLRDVERMPLAEIERKIREFGERARDGKLTLDELTGGTFTISNGGVFGSLQSTPILNPPQSAILGMHKIQDRPIAENGSVVIRPMMYLALSYDHRIIDGREAVQFLETIRKTVEDPTRILLQI
ncbi:MAG: 2-oxoglutarate dehydrogenase complex dihydrolipoyllysine-residue succinyltransferase [Proteobacteria bacterium]|nr:MAG: 2-oxoglutarate dehydrogenase complex dihydrolipoyllysine-residue succinyltransferase [Pseudomonadota bacterium]